MTGAETDLDLGHYERFKVQRLMPARVVEAIGDQTAHALAPHVGEVHRRAGFVLGHGVLVRNARRRVTAATLLPRRLVAAGVIGTVADASLDHPAIAHKWRR
jgi:hypothetical protein